jgi:hypothetical protein
MSEPIANVDMAKAWDGEQGDQWTQFADEFDANFRSIWARFVETDPIAPADRVLDIVKGLSDGLDDVARADAHEKLKAALRSHETPEGVRFGSAVWLVTARKS